MKKFYLRKLRKRAKMTQSYVSSALGFSQAVYNQIEQGHRDVKDSEWTVLAGLFGVPTDDLRNGTLEMNDTITSDIIDFSTVKKEPSMKTINNNITKNTMNGYNFEQITAESPKKDTDISISAKGRLTFMQGAIEKISIDSDSYLLLFFDKEKNTLGLKKTIGAVSNSNKVSTAKSGLFKLNLKKSLGKQGVDFPSIKGRYTIKQITVPEIGSMYIVELEG